MQPYRFVLPERSAKEHHFDPLALQAQLAQTLFGQQITSTSNEQETTRQSSYIQPCNTPTGRTPSLSLSRGQMADAQRRSSATSRRYTDENWRDGDEEDERMVEDILIPSLPVSANPTTSQFSLPPQHASTKSQSSIHNAFPPSTSSQSFGTYPAEPSPSLFTSTDPFYIAQVQATQNHNTSFPSIFSQTGRPTQQSPFLTQQQHYQSQRRDNHGYIPSTPVSLALDPHSLFVRTSAAFER